jgi:hypothetical protein
VALVKVTSRFGQDAQESLSATVAPAVGNQVLQHNQFSTTVPLSPTTTPPASKVISQKPTLVTGALVIDLTAATHLGQAVDCSGLKLQELLLINENTHAVTIEADASNGYLLFGTAGKVAVPAKTGVAPGILHMHFADGTPDVDGTHKNIKLTGTGTEQFKLQMVFG